MSETEEVEQAEIPHQGLADAANNGILLEGTRVDDSTWTHYTDLSGLEWNG